MSPAWLRFGWSEICAVWMSAAAIPRPLSAEITLFIFAAFAASAALAVSAFAATPNVKSAVVGVVLTLPVP